MVKMMRWSKYQQLWQPVGWSDVCVFKVDATIWNVFPIHINFAANWKAFSENQKASSENQKVSSGRLLPKNQKVSSGRLLPKTSGFVCMHLGFRKMVQLCLQISRTCVCNRISDQERFLNHGVNFEDAYRMLYLTTVL